MDYKGSCPRCKAAGVEVGSSIFQLGKTRAMKLTIYNCSRCNLVFFEKASEE